MKNNGPLIMENRSFVLSVGVVLLMCFMFFGSCNKDPVVIEEEEEKDPPAVFHYVYTGEHYMDDFHVYVGPKGEEILTNEELAKHLWGEYSMLDQPSYDTLVIDTRNKLLHMDDFWTEGVDLKIAINGDTVKENQNNFFEYFGRITDDSTFVMNRAFYSINYVGREEGYSDYSHVGHYGYWRWYEEARIQEFFHANSRYGSLSDLNLPSDTIAYLTKYYVYKLIKAE